jgi:hypothetical protein
MLSKEKIIKLDCRIPENRAKLMKYLKTLPYFQEHDTKIASLERYVYEVNAKSNCKLTSMMMSIEDHDLTGFATNKKNDDHIVIFSKGIVELYIKFILYACYGKLSKGDQA